MSTTNTWTDAKGRWNRYCELVKCFRKPSGQEVLSFGEDAKKVSRVYGEETEVTWCCDMGASEEFRTINKEISSTLKASRSDYTLARCLDSNMAKGVTPEHFFEKKKRNLVLSPGIKKVGNIYPKSDHEAGNVYSVDGLSPTIKCNGPRPNKNNISPKIISPCITVGQTEAIAKCIGLVPEICKKRRFETPKEINEWFKSQLKSFGKTLTIKQIAEEMCLPKTQVEHYFRIDKSRAIPSPENWFKLKKILWLADDDTYDKQVTEIYEKEIEFEQTRRVYSEDGLSPTVNATKEPIVYKSHRADEMRESIDSPCLTKNMGDGGNNVPMVMDYRKDEGFRPRKNGESPSLTSHGDSAGGIPVPMVVAQRGRNPDDPSDRTTGAPTEQRFEPNSQDISNTLTNVGKDNLVAFCCEEMNDIANTVTPDAYLQKGERKRVNDKPILTSAHERRLRRLTPTECERLQAFPDSWTKWGIDEKENKVEISDTQRYKMMGNAVSCCVIEAIIKNIFSNI